MKEKTIVFGATGGVGEWICRQMPKCSVHMVARQQEALLNLERELGHTSTQGDVLEEELFKRVVIEADGPIAGLVYGIGNIRLKNLKRLESSEIIEDFRLHALGASLAIQGALPKMVEGSSIVLFSSVAVSRGFPNHTSVSLAKGAIEGLTRALAAELAPKIRINAIAPSLTDTPMASSLLSNDSMRENLSKSHPLQRIGRVEDVGALALHLLAPASGWITGQVIGVDGGRGSVAGR